MKIIIAFTLFIVGISAFPKLHEIDLKNERLVTDAIASAIQDASQAIVDAGLDPFYIESRSATYALPVPVIFNAEGVIEQLLITGLSNIAVNSLSFSILTYRLTFDIEVPLIETTLDKVAVDAVLFGKEYSLTASGSLAISRIRVIGDVRASVGIISGISIRSLAMDFSLGGIESALNLTVQDWELSDYLNTLLGSTIPNTLNNYSDEINELIEIIVLDIISGIL